MKLAFSAKHILTTAYQRISPKESLHKAISMFDKDIDALVVFENGKYKGMVTEKAILGKWIRDPEAKVRAVAISSPKIEPNTTLEECARLLIECDANQLPVFERQELIGIVTVGRLLENAVKIIGRKKARDIMRTEPITCSADDSIGKMMTLLRENNISRIILMNKENIAGILSVHDIIKRALKPQSRQKQPLTEKTAIIEMPASTIMSAPLSVHPDEELKEVVALMNKAEENCVIVVNEQNKPMGIITKKDILEKITYEPHKGEEIFVQLSSKVENLDRKCIIDEINTFIKKHSKHLGEGSIYVYITKHREKLHHLSLMYCRIHIHTSALDTAVQADGWGEEQMIKNALRKLKATMLKTKELKQKFSEKEYYEFADIESM